LDASFIHIRIDMENPFNELSHDMVMEAIIREPASASNVSYWYC
jgi:hypothetical protein